MSSTSDVLPELSLLAAMLDLAIRDAAGRAPAVEIKRALDWISSDSRDAFSFRYACEYLELDPQAIRRALQERAKWGRYNSQKCSYDAMVRRYAPVAECVTDEPLQLVDHRESVRYG